MTCRLLLTALTETVDVDAVGLSDSLVAVIPAEYGNAVLLTIRLRTDDFLIGFDPDVSNLLNYNMVDTIDTLARTAIDAGGTEVTHTATAETDITAGDDITVALVRQQRAALRSASVLTWGSSYGAVIHPDVAYDLKSETGDGSWTAAAQYSEVSRIWNDEIGTYAGVRFIESPRAKVNTKTVGHPRWTPTRLISLARSSWRRLSRLLRIWFLALLLIS